MSRLRAPIVAELAAQSSAYSTPWTWRWLPAATWLATLVGGATLFCVDYPGNARGDHALKGAQLWVRAAYEDAVLGGARAPPPPPPPPPPPAPGGALR